MYPFVSPENRPLSLGGIQIVGHPLMPPDVVLLIGPAEHKAYVEEALESHLDVGTIALREWCKVQVEANPLEASSDE